MPNDEIRTFDILQVMTKLYIFCGIPFSGKTVLAKKVSEKLDYIRVDLDDIKFEIFGNTIKDSEINKKGWDAVYKEMYNRIENNLKNGKTVVSDTGNFTKYERGLVKKIADKLNIESVEVFVNTPVDVARKRLFENLVTKERFQITEKEFNSAVREMETPSSNNVITYNYPESIDQWIEKIF